MGNFAVVKCPRRYYRDYEVILSTTRAKLGMRLENLRKKIVFKEGGGKSVEGAKVDAWERGVESIVEGNEMRSCEDRERCSWSGKFFSLV